MEPRARFERLFAHAAWADREVARAVAAALAAGAPLEPRAVPVLAHLVATGWLWLRRLGREAPDCAVWPDWDPGRSLADIAPLHAAWTAFLADEGALEGRISYVNSAGVRWTSEVLDVVDHVLQHGAHHRGQLAALLRAAGREAPYVDLVHAARSGVLAPRRP